MRAKLLLPLLDQIFENPRKCRRLAEAAHVHHFAVHPLPRPLIDRTGIDKGDGPENITLCW